MTSANLLVIVPWVIFGGGLAAVCYRLVSRRGGAHRHRRDSR